MKGIGKWFANGAAAVLVSPAVVCLWMGARLVGANKAFAGWSQAFGLLPGLTGIYLRRAFYSWVLPRCEADVCISFGTILSHPTARFGRTVYVGAYCCLGDVTLEDDVLVASHVSIANGTKQHGIDRLDIPVREQPGQWPHITIGQDSWIGDRAVVLADVGQHCVIGAGAVVTRPIPDYAIAVGNPARVVRDRRERGAESEERRAKGGEAE
jgi:virginiamycin A acetyltransferase